MRRFGSCTLTVGMVTTTVAALLATSGASAHAAALEVTTTSDEFGGGPKCSLREALESARSATAFGGCVGAGVFGNDVISVPDGDYRLSRPGSGEDLGASGDLDIHSGLSIVHQGPGTATVDARGIDRAIENHAAAPVQVSGLEITGGVSPTDGGGVLQSAVPTLTLRNVTVSGSRAIADGGGVASYGGLAAHNVTISGNRANGSGGGVYGPGGSSVTLYNTTVAGNRADADANNTGNGGGVASVAALSTYNTIIGDNADSSPAPANRVPDCDTGPSFFPRFTLIETFQPGNCLVGFNPGSNLVGMDPMLGSLADGGGPVRTRALLTGSPALEAGGESGIDVCETVDARGVPRSLGGACDLGAIEEASCGGVRVNLVGTGSADRLAGGAGADGALAFGGRDKVSGKNGKDSLCGGAGGDKLKGGGGKDKLKGGAGTDRCNGGRGRDKGPGCERKREIP